MTIRVRPVVRGRSSRDPNRRTFYVNLAFAITVLVAILILVVVGITTWYNAHLAELREGIAVAIAEGVRPG